MSSKQGFFQADKFINRENGSVSVIFAVVLTALLLGAGIAFDYTRSVSLQTDMQGAADSAVLAAVRAKTNNGKLNDNKLTKIAREFFDNNTGGLLDIQSFKLVPDGDGYRVEVSATLRTTLMSVAGYTGLDVSVSSTAEIGPGRPLELALVLDNTGSMSGSKLTALKDSANLLVDKILDETDNKKPTKITLVPFSDHVNVGLPNRNAPWIDVADDYSEIKNVCSNTYPDKVKSNCRMETRTGTSDGVPYTYETQVCDTDYGDAVQVCEDKTYNYTWRGCVGSRDYPMNVKDESYNLDKVPGMLNVWCRDPITPLTADKAVITAGIDAMSASGNTYIPAGLTWGWRALSQTKPYNEGKKYIEMKDTGGIKAIVLMTDGMNTRSPRYPDHWGSDTNLANTLTSELCTNIKAEDITVYTIAFEVTDADTKDLLQNCATNASYYFDATDSDKLATAFEVIAGQLSQLRLTD